MLHNTWRSHSVYYFYRCAAEVAFLNACYILLNDSFNSFNRTGHTLKKSQAHGFGIDPY